MLFAAVVVASGTFLLYTAVVAPVQIFLWEFDEAECKNFPTLYFDLFVDTFFIVRLALYYVVLRKQRILDFKLIIILSVYH